MTISLMHWDIKALRTLAERADSATAANDPGQEWVAVPGPFINRGTAHTLINLGLVENITDPDVSPHHFVKINDRGLRALNIAPNNTTPEDGLITIHMEAP